MEFILDYDDTKNKHCVARDLIICETEHTWPKFVKRDHFFIASVQSNTFCIVSIYDFREQIQAIFLCRMLQMATTNTFQLMSLASRAGKIAVNWNWISFIKMKTNLILNTQRD